MLRPWEIAVALGASVGVFILVYLNGKTIKKNIKDLRAKGEMSERINKAIISILFVVFCLAMFLKDN